MSFYNTTNLSGDKLKEAIQKAKSQDEAILALFKHEQRPIGPSEVQSLFLQRGYRWLLTSIRRSLSSLTKKGSLTKRKNDSKVPSVNGAEEYTWELVKTGGV